MRSAILFGVLLATALPGAARAQEYLTAPGPRDAILQSYQDDLALVFAEAFRPDVAAQAYLKPGDAPETALGLRRGANGYEIFALTPSRLVWSYQLLKLMKGGQIGVVGGGGGMDQEIGRIRKGLPRKPKDLPLTRCAAPLAAETGDAIVQAWQAMLKGPRGDKQLGRRGPSYQFFLPEGGTHLTGEVVWPVKESGTGRLVALAEAMLAYCRAGGQQGADDLTTLARAASKGTLGG